MPCARSQITKYPLLFVSPSLDWLAWRGLASLASAWLVSLAAATTTATTPEQAYYITIGAALRAAAMGMDAWSRVVAVVVAAAHETSHAETRRATPSRASQSREGLTNDFGLAGQSCNPLTLGCASGHIHFVTGPCSKPTRGGHVLTS